MSIRKPILFYELNEVPLRLLDSYCEQFPNSAISEIVQQSRVFESYTEDEGHLSPWITWPSLHRGVTNVEHGIYDFGQDLAEPDKNYPPIWQLLTDQGVNVGLFGSLHSYPLPKCTEHYSFFVPDTFAAGAETLPAKLSSFQKFNLMMVDRSGRNVTTGIPLGGAIKFVLSAPGLGLRMSTVWKVAKQIVSERLTPERVVRRRTTQAQVAFDFFLKELKNKAPDASFFFTNHVASSMHRYWPALFPQDYKESSWSESWRETYKDEIWYSLQVADDQLRDLKQWCDQTNTTLVVSSSMGQAAVEGQDLVVSELNINDFDVFMTRLGLTSSDWERKRAMVPMYMVKVLESKVEEFRQRLARFRVNGEAVQYVEYDGGVFRIEIGYRNLKDSEIAITNDGKDIGIEEAGLVNNQIQDAAGSNAYHIPEGTLVIYNPGDNRTQTEERERVSTLELAPAILSRFGIESQSYMSQVRALGGVID